MTRTSLVLRGSLLAAVLLFPAAAQADTFTVSTTADPPDGVLRVCPASPLGPCTLRAAVSRGDTVLVPPGTYTLSSPLELSHAVTIEATDPASPPVIHAAPEVGTVQGGAIVAPAGTALVLRDVIIEGATVDIAIDAGTADSVTLDGVTMRDNSGQATLEAPLRTLIEGSTFSHNSSPGAGAIGVELDHALLQIHNSVFDHNHSRDGGGAVSLVGQSQNVQIDASSFLHNSAQDGGAIGMLDSAGSALAVSNSTFDGDVADRGAALFVDENSGQPQITLSHDTLIDETAASGGALDGALSNARLGDSVLAGDRGGSCGSPGIVSAGHNVTDDHSCALSGPGDRQDLDSRLGPIADNGGPVPTAVPQLDSRLLDGAGGPCPALDARGVSRPQGAACDIGATERAITAPAAMTGPATGAAVSGTVDAGGQTTSVSVDYGPTSAYGASVRLADVSGWLPLAVAGRLPARRPGTVTHYRVRAENPTGEAVGGDLTITTQAPPHLGTGLRISHLRVSVAHRPLSIVVQWSASAAGRLRIAARARAAGRWVTRASFVTQSRLGANRVAFPPKLLGGSKPARTA